MAKTKKQAAESEGVAVRTDQPRNARYEDGVPVLVPDVPEQTAGAKAGQSADNTKKES